MKAIVPTEQVINEHGDIIRIVYHDEVVTNDKM